MTDKKWPSSSGASISNRNTDTGIMVRDNDNEPMRPLELPKVCGMGVTVESAKHPRQISPEAQPDDLLFFKGLLIALPMALAIWVVVGGGGYGIYCLIQKLVG